MRHIILEIIIVIVVLLIAGISTYCSYNHDDDIPVIVYIPNTKIEVNDTLIDYINKYRTENNLCIVLPEQGLIDASKIRVAFLKTQDTLTHNGFTSINIGAKSLGEIVAKGYKTNLSLFKAYQKSAIHNKIMLSDFKYVGSFTEDTYNCVLFAK